MKFYNCTNEADIIGLRNVAGLVGYNSGGQSITFEACVNIGDITSLQGTYTISGKPINIIGLTLSIPHMEHRILDLIQVRAELSALIPAI